MAFLEIDRAYIVQFIGKIDLENNNHFIVKKIQIENIEDCQSFNDENTILTFKNFLAKGYLGYFCYYNEQCILRLWFFNNSERTFVGRNFIYILDKNEYFFGWSETKESARGIGAYPYTLQIALNNLNAQQISAYIAKENIASLNGVKKAGFKVVRKFFLVKVGKLRIQFEYKRLNKKFFFVTRIGSKIKSVNVNEKD